MRKVIVDPGKIIDGPGLGEPSVFGKIESGEGWQLKWVGPDDAGESLPADTRDVFKALDQHELVGLLLPAVQKVSEQVSFNFVKITWEDTEEFDRLLEEGAFGHLDDVLVLNPESAQAGGFLKIGDIKGESQDTPDMGAWTPLSDFSDADLF